MSSHPTLPLPHTLQHLQFGRPCRWPWWHCEHLLGSVGSPVWEVPPHHDGVCRSSHQDPRQVLVPQEFPLSVLQGTGWVDVLFLFLMLKIEKRIWWSLRAIICLLAPLFLWFFEIQGNWIINVLRLNLNEVWWKAEHVNCWVTKIKGHMLF